MFFDDTICAVSTPAGTGGIGIIRVSGRDAVTVAARVCRLKSGYDLADMQSHTIRYGHVVDPKTEKIVDEMLISVMRAPATYTREDIVEINCHGGMAALWKTMSLLIDAGARQAQPGEFTKRAFLNGRIDLAQAEAVMDIIRARTDAGLRAAAEQLEGGLSGRISALRERLLSLFAFVEAGVDFPEEEIEMQAGSSLESEIAAVLEEIHALLNSLRYGRIVREGAAMAIIGRPNVGKSSLLNALLAQDRAIVTDVPGTTRDVLEESLNIDGFLFRVLDTAGIRHSQDPVEQEGIRRSYAAAESADVVVVVLDGSSPFLDEDRRVLDAVKNKTVVAVINKSDLPRRLENLSWPERQVALSCRTGDGIDLLRREIKQMVAEGAAPPQEHAWAVNKRHATALEQAKAALAKALAAARQDLSPEFIALDLRDALDHVGLIIGATYTEDILERIFRDFCIGK